MGTNRVWCKTKTRLYAREHNIMRGPGEARGAHFVPINTDFRKYCIKHYFRQNTVKWRTRKNYYAINTAIQSEKQREIKSRTRCRESDGPKIRSQLKIKSTMTVNTE